MNTQHTNAQADALLDIELDAAAGGVRHEVTREEWERIVGKWIYDAKNKK